MKTLAGIFLLLAASLPASMQTVRPSVSVIGEADINVAPDEVDFTFEIITTNRQVPPAKQENDRIFTKVLDVTKSFRIAPEDVQTSSLTISPKYTSAKDPRGENVLTGYQVKNRFVVTLKDLKNIDSFLSKAIEAGVNQVVSVDIGNSKYQEHQERVRAMAVKNAEEKGRAYAKQLGLTLGKAYVIREEGADQPGYTSGFGNGEGNGDGVGDITSQNGPPLAFDRTVTFALGQINISEKIYVTFALN